MARLSVRLLGPLGVTLDGEPVTGLRSDKVRALLAYLAVETQLPHRRETLAGLLWPDWPERSARANLRQALANLRQAIADHQAMPPFLLISRQTIQFNSASDAWVDVTAFTKLVKARAGAQQTIPQQEEAVALYRGAFLEGFSIGDSPAFEEWALLHRERFHRLMVEALHRLAACHEQGGDYEAALQHAWRQVELDPWREKAHQQVMRLLALSGQRGAALAQYETCRRLLAEELGVEPAKETTALYEQIKDSKLEVPVPTRPPDLVAEPPSFLGEEEPVAVERPVFIAREGELAQLGGFLDIALAGQGRVAFVTGEAGSGKTALIQGFTRRAQELHTDLVVAGGNCNAHTGVGDPYLPFREILGLLTGDVEARWAAGSIPTGHARRLWNTLPPTAQALVEAGPDLVDTFVPGTALVERAMACVPGGAAWLTALGEHMERKAAIPGAPSPDQSALFEQYTRVLQALARQAPLLLVVDDLQWADLGSISLLFHLGRHLAGSPILIVGAYRSEEVALGRDGKRHPLEPVVNQFQLDFGDIAVDLGEAESRDFVEAFLDSEPNRLGVAFREMLYRQTRGHPLFTVELLRGMQERGDLIQDEAGRWIEGPALDWETLPARVEAVIAERIGRLPQPLRAALRAASVEGEIFTAEVLARVRAADEGEMVARLSGELDRRHRLVSARGILRRHGQRLSRYRFRHILFQKYLYSKLDQVERTYLHEGVATALENVYGEEAEEIAVQLARHFEEAGVLDKAVAYRLQAGNKAVRLSANEAAIAHFTQGLALLENLPDTPERAQQELLLQISLSAPLVATRGYAAPEVGRACARARELCKQVGEMPQLFSVVFQLFQFYGVRAEYETALDLLEQNLSLGERAEDQVLVAMSRWGMGYCSLFRGELTRALDHLEHVIAFYDPEQHHALAFIYGLDPGVACLSWSSWVLWLLGYPDQALKRGQEVVALAQELSHPHSLACARGLTACLHQFRRELEAAQASAEPTIALSTEHAFPLWLTWMTFLHGWALAEQGQAKEGIAQMRDGMTAYLALGTEGVRPMMLAQLAEAYAKVGQTTEALCTLDEAFAQVEKTGERYYEAEIHRLMGELLLLQGDEAGAEGSFDKAIEVAREESAKSWELRATVSLCHLFQGQGRQKEARQLLAEIYGWFTEGSDTPDLKEAKALLEELC